MEEDTSLKMLGQQVWAWCPAASSRIMCRQSFGEPGFRRTGEVPWPLVTLEALKFSADNSVRVHLVWWWEWDTILGQRF